MSLFIEDQSPWIFIIMTVILGGGAAFMAGRGMAMKWRPLWMPILAMVPLTMGLRFLHFALFDAELTSLHYLITDFVVMVAASFLGYRTTLASKMARQYPWLYEKTSPLSWRPKA